MTRCWCRTRRWNPSPCRPGAGRSSRAIRRSWACGQYVEIAQGAGRLHGKVALTERLGSETVLDVTLKDASPLIAALSQDVIFEVGMPVDLTFDPDKAHLLQEDATMASASAH